MADDEIKEMCRGRWEGGRGTKQGAAMSLFLCLFVELLLCMFAFLFSQFHALEIKANWLLDVSTSRPFYVRGRYLCIFYLFRTHE